MAVSRRVFLQALGAGASSAALGVAAPPSGWLQPPRAAPAALGRALCAAPVLDRAGHVSGWLFPDSLVELLSEKGDAYITHAGRVARAYVQPLDRPGEGMLPAQLPAWVEVRASSAPLRRWADASAEHVGTVGHGGVLAAVDRLLVNDEEWLGVAAAPDGVLLGWTPALRWRETPVAAGPALADHLLLDAAAGRLSAFGAGGGRWEWAAAVRPLVKSVRYPLRPGRHCGCWQGAPGVPWLLSAGPLTLGGAYWHNAFGPGSPGQAWLGPDVHLPPAAARWLYLYLSEGAALEIV